MNSSQKISPVPFISSSAIILLLGAFIIFLGVPEKGNPNSYRQVPTLRGASK